jgi:hypothetical protein
MRLEFGGQTPSCQSWTNAFNQSQAWAYLLYSALGCLAKPRYGSFMTSTADRNWKGWATSQHRIL